eukprot:evm.model.NODE_23176_length_15026_cov_24.516239.2
MKKGVVTREQVFAAKGLDDREFLDPSKPSPPADDQECDSKAHPFENATLEELDEADGEDDGGAYDDDSVMAKFREMRLKEWKEKQARERYGDVVEICKDDWIREVTEGSKGGGGEGQWVVVHLYQDRVEECRLLDEILREVAFKFKSLKILKILSTAAVENWPDRNLPTLFVYKDGVLKTQMLGLKKVGGRGVRATDLEWWLAGEGIVETEMEENPREEEGRERRRGGFREKVGGLRRGYAEDEEDDD